MYHATCSFNANIAGSRFYRAIASSPKVFKPFNHKSQPDWVTKDVTSLEQLSIYKLNGILTFVYRLVPLFNIVSLLTQLACNHRSPHREVYWLHWCRSAWLVAYDISASRMYE